MLHFRGSRFFANAVLTRHGLRGIAVQPLTGPKGILVLLLLLLRFTFTFTASASASARPQRTKTTQHNHNRKNRA